MSLLLSSMPTTVSHARPFLHHRTRLCLARSLRSLRRLAWVGVRELRVLLRGRRVRVRRVRLNPCTAPTPSIQRLESTRDRCDAFALGVVHTRANFPKSKLVQPSLYRVSVAALTTTDGIPKHGHARVSATETHHTHTHERPHTHLHAGEETAGRIAPPRSAAVPTPAPPLPPA